MTTTDVNDMRVDGLLLREGAQRETEPHPTKPGSGKSPLASANKRAVGSSVRLAGGILFILASPACLERRSAFTSHRRARQSRWLGR
jgi:hypothetical protein